MTIWCNTCRRLVRAPCTSHRRHRPVDQRRYFCRSFRSTKGASKARRDHINHEIRNMRALLPISQEDQERLSYLHSMAAICTYIRKSVLFQGLVAGGKSYSSLPYQAFLQALHGFILVTTIQGKLVYVSENVSDYLGLSLIDVLQGDTFCDLIESSDVDLVKANLDFHNSASAERSFVCHMQTSKAFKLQHGSCCSILVKGSFQSVSQPPSFSSSLCVTDQPLFVALCTPTVNRLQSDNGHLCHSFSSVHRLDMRFTQVSDSVLYFLGYSNEEMEGQSWYSLVHPEDLSSLAESHQSLVKADEGFQVEMVLRLQCKDLLWTWTYIQAKKYPECQGLNCKNFIISKTEARFLLTKISTDAFRPSHQANSCRSAAQQLLPSSSSSSSKSFKRQISSNSHSEELLAAKVKRSDEDKNLMAYISFQSNGSPGPLVHGAALITPPCSPASCCSPAQQEELSHGLLTDMHGCTDQLLSSPEGSPSYFTYLEGVPACHFSAPNSAGANQTFEQAAFGVLGDLASPLASSSTCDFQACTPDARFVPDCLSMCDMPDISLECALHQDDRSLLEQPQESSPVQAQHVPHHVFPALSGLLTPRQSPSSAEADRYIEREQVEISILAQQISCLASSFTKHHTLTPLQNASAWPNHPPLHHSKSDVILDDGVFDLILDLDTRKTSNPYQQCIPDIVTPAEQLTVLDTFSLEMGHHDQHSGLHQLRHYTESSFQPDGFTEESLY